MLNRGEQAQKGFRPISARWRFMRLFGIFLGFLFFGILCAFFENLKKFKNILRCCELT